MGSTVDGSFLGEDSPLFIRSNLDDPLTTSLTRTFFCANVSSERSVDRCSVNKIKIAELTSNKTAPLPIDDVSINVQAKN